MSANPNMNGAILNRVIAPAQTPSDYIQKFPGREKKEVSTITTKRYGVVPGEDEASWTAEDLRARNKLWKALMAASLQFFSELDTDNLLYQQGICGDNMVLVTSDNVDGNSEPNYRKYAKVFAYLLRREKHLLSFINSEHEGTGLKRKAQINRNISTKLGSLWTSLVPAKVANIPLLGPHWSKNGSYAQNVYLWYMVACPFPGCQEIGGSEDGRSEQQTIPNAIRKAGVNNMGTVYSTFIDYSNTISIASYFTAAIIKTGPRISEFGDYTFKFLNKVIALDNDDLEGAENQTFSYILLIFFTILTVNILVNITIASLKKLGISGEFDATDRKIPYYRWIESGLLGNFLPTSTQRHHPRRNSGTIAQLPASCWFLRGLHSSQKYQPSMSEKRLEDYPKSESPR
ncbi:hypothetical protein BJ742DRAFT_870966 [Cladochytrium replicatum]|nr:hypothetical protein BJ742DRAFT_870966 [Cladochytrium replicatum]